MNDDQYFTAVEQHFQRARGTASFHFTPKDWGLIETRRNSGIPLEAIFRGVDRSFDNWRNNSPRARIEKVNSLAYCSSAVESEARALANVLSSARPVSKRTSPRGDIQGLFHLQREHQ
jgi:hypothetical protein